MDDPEPVLAEVVRILEEQGVDYVLVGSMASSLHGMYRSTADLDLLADIKQSQLTPLVNSFHAHFYVDELAAREAVAKRRSFNVIHYASVFKVDIFIPRDDFGQKQLERRELRELNANNRVFVATAEDTILAKLRWYRAGAEISTNHWNDVLGVLAANRKNLDSDYLNEWAEQLKVLDLLETARTESERA